MIGRIAVVLVVAAIALGVLWNGEPAGRDQSLFLAQGGELLDGGALYTNVWEHKPPGVILAHAASQLLFGRGEHAARLLSRLAGLFAAIGIAALVLRVGGSSVGAALAGLLYLGYQGGVVFGGFWATAQAELLMDPLIVAALLALWGREVTTWRALFAGVCVAGTIGLKYSALPFVLLVVPLLATRQAIVFLAGVAGPALAWLAWLWRTGRVDAFFEATVAFNLAHAGVAREPLFENVVGKLFYAPAFLAPFYACVAIAAVVAVVDAGRRRTILAAGALWLLTLAQVFWQGKFWVYHFHVVLLPLSVIAGLASGSALARVRDARGRIVLVALLLATLVPNTALVRAYALTHGIGVAVADLDSYVWGGSDFSAAETRRVGERIHEESSAGDRVFVWGFEPGIYVHGKRRPASRYFYDYPLMPRFEALHAEHLRRLMSDLERHEPELILVVDRDANDIEPRSSLQQLVDVPPLKRLLERSYEPAWKDGDFWVLRRRHP